MRRIKQILLFLLCAFSLTAASLPTTKPEDVGLSSERLQRIHAMVQRHMDLGDITGAVMLVARKGQIAYVDVAGHDGRRNQKAHDARLAVSHGIHDQARDRHRHHDDARRRQAAVGRSGIQIYPRIQGHEGWGAAGHRAVGAGNPPKFYTVPAEREITIKDLLTHTSGLSSGPMGQSEVAKVRRKPTETLADYIPRLASTPLEFQPGTRWMYSPSDGFDVLGADRRNSFGHAAQSSS